jgi:hypothetical protein
MSKHSTIQDGLWDGFTQQAASTTHFFGQQQKEHKTWESARPMRSMKQDELLGRRQLAMHFFGQLRKECKI